MPEDNSPFDEEDRARQSTLGHQFASELLAELERVDPDVFRGQGRFPAARELRYAPAQVRSIIAIAKSALLDWSDLPEEVTSGIVDGLKSLVRIMGEIEALPLVPEHEIEMNAGTRAGFADARLEELLQFFTTTVEPSLPRDPPGEGRPSERELENMRRTRKELDLSQERLTELEARYAQINSELESQRDLVEAARTESGSTGAQDLAEAYREQAQDQAKQWKYWGVGLAASTIIALVLGYAALKVNKPADHATTSELISHVAIDILVVGILIYVIRVMSLQFSVHRHLAAVAQNKAAALTTFSRIVSSGSSSETRDRLAEVLANHVFVSGDTGFLDAAGDQITLPERLAAPVSERLAGRGTPRTL